MRTHLLTIDQYLGEYSGEVLKRLQKMRECIREAAPEATEAIKYGMPTFVLYGNLVHFAACKSHIGFYPSPSAIQEFQEALLPYHTSRGAIQLPYDQPLPLDLVKKITLFRAKENQLRAENKKKPG